MSVLLPVLGRLVLIHHIEVPCGECIFLTVGCRGGETMHCGAVGSTQHILPAANVLTQCSHEKPPVGTADGGAESVNPRDCRDRSRSYWPVGEDHFS